jgi:hypothetical protein
MTQLEFIAAIVKALAWPTAILAIVIVLKRQISLVMDRLSRFSYKELHIDFARELDHLRATAVAANVPAAPAAVTNDSSVLRALRQAEELAADFPEAAVGSAWAALESALYEALGRVVGNEHMRFDPYAPISIARHLRDIGQLDTKTVDLLTELRNLRNHAVHNPGHPGLGMISAEAVEYIAHARGLVLRLAELKRPAK